MSAPVVGICLATVSLVVGVMVGCSGEADTAVTTSSPPRVEEVAVPDLVGLGPDEALARLCAAGLAIRQVRVVERTPEVGPRPSAALAASRVLGTEPAAGRRVTAGQDIDLRFSVPENAVLATPDHC